MEGISITVEDGFTLSVPDMSTPSWFGDYQGGKLAVYFCNVAGDNAPEGHTYLAVYTGHGGPDFMTYATYEFNVPGIVEHLQRTVFDAYELAIKDAAYSKLMDGSPTLH